MRACSVCFFFRGDIPRTENGECFNRPPMIFPFVNEEGEMNFVSQRPIVLRQDFCAFFQHKSEVAKKEIERKNSGNVVG